MAEIAERTHWVDIARGIGIWCVVAGHWITLDVFGPRIYGFCNLLYAFHMPLFFVFSGMMCKRFFSKNTLVSKMDSLLVPYLLYTPILLICLGWSGAFSRAQWINGLRAFLLFDGVGVTWFFPCLFVTEMIGIFIIDYVRNHWSIVFLVVASAVIGFLVNVDSVRRFLPQVFKCRTVPMALVFWLLGALAQRSGLLGKKLKPTAISIVLIICIVGLGLRLDYRCNFAHAMIGSPTLFYFAAISGVTMVVVVSRLVGKNAPLEWCGRNSILILVTHSIVPILTAIMGGGIILNMSVTLLACIGLSHAGPVFSGHSRLFRRLISCEGTKTR